VSPHTLLFHRVLSCLAGTEFATLEDPPPVQPERPVLSSQLQGVNSKHAIPQLPQCSTMCALACIPTRLHSQACLRQTCAAPCRFAKGVLAGVVPWCEARRFFAWRLKRRLTEEGLIRHISSTDVSISRLDAIAMVRRMACAVWREGRVCAVSFRGGGGCVFGRMTSPACLVYAVHSGALILLDRLPLQKHRVRESLPRHSRLLTPSLRGCC
jgi:hypothetical protein